MRLHHLKLLSRKGAAACEITRMDLNLKLLLAWSGFEFPMNHEVANYLHCLHIFSKVFIFIDFGETVGPSS